jgi:hypothetical protein
MSNRKNTPIALLVLAALVPLALGAFPLWLDVPKRSNTHDPKSADHTPGASGSTTPSPTATSTVSASGHGPLVSDFQSTTNAANTYWNSGTIFTSVDSAGSSITPATWSNSSPTAPLGSGNSSSKVARISGNLAAQLAPPYTYAYMAMELTTTGATHPNATNVDVDVSSYTTNSGITFDYRVPNATTVVYRLELVQNGASGTGFYQANIDPAGMGTNDGNWHTMTIYFPGSTAATAGAPHVFSQPGWATAFAWNTKIGALQFQVNPTASVQAYDLSIDNVTFTSPVYTPASHTGLVADFEPNSNDASNADTYWNSGVIYNGIDANGTTMIPAVWTTGSATAPLGSGDSSANVARISGTLKAQSPTASIYTYAYLGLELAAGGSTHPSGSNVDVDVSSYSANSGISFDYRVPATNTATYRLELVQNGATNTGFYQCNFTPVADGNWHTITMYFPGSTAAGSGAPNVFGLPGWATAFAWNTKIGALQFQVNPTGSDQSYDLSIDNVTFNAPVYTPPVHTALVADFEPNSNDGNNANTYWNSGTVLTVADTTDACTIIPATWTTGSANAPLGTGNSSANVAHITGVLKAQTAPPWTYAYLGLELNANGAQHPNASNVDVNVASYCPNNGLQFDYRVPNASAVSYRVELVQNGATNNGYFQSNFTAVADGNWHTAVIYFPNSSSALAGAPNVFALPGWATSFAWTTKIGAIFFQVNPTTSDQNYDLSIDNVTFAAPAYTPPATPTFTVPASDGSDGHTVMDFEDNGLSDNMNCALTAAKYQGPAHSGAGGGSTINTWDLPGNSLGTSPGNASTYCGQFYGKNATGGYAVFEMLLINGGYLGGGGSIDLSTFCVNKRMRFDYRAMNDANGNGQNVTYAMQWMTQNITDYDFYEYDFTPTDTNWHTAVVYWPSSSYSPKLQPAYCDNAGCGGSGSGPYAFDPSQTGEFILRIVSNAAAPGLPFNIQIDNLDID